MFSIENISNGGNTDIRFSCIDSTVFASVVDSALYTNIQCTVLYTTLYTLHIVVYSTLRTT